MAKKPGFSPGVAFPHNSLPGRRKRGADPLLEAGADAAKPYSPRLPKHCNRPPCGVDVDDQRGLAAATATSIASGIAGGRLAEYERCVPNFRRQSSFGARGSGRGLPGKVGIFHEPTSQVHKPRGFRNVDPRSA